MARRATARPLPFVAPVRHVAPVRLIALFATLLVLAPGFMGLLHASAAPSAAVRPERVEFSANTLAHHHDCPLCADLARTGSDLPTSAPRASLVGEVVRGEPLRGPQRHDSSLLYPTADPRAPPHHPLLTDC